MHLFHCPEAELPLDGSTGFIGRKGAAAGIIRLNSPLVSVSRLNGFSHRNIVVSLHRESEEWMGQKRTQNPQKNTEAFAQMPPGKTKDTEKRRQIL